jgi:hypothetical protein
MSFLKRPVALSLLNSRDNLFGKLRIKLPLPSQVAAIADEAVKATFPNAIEIFVRR